MNEQVKDIVKVASGIGCGLLLYIVGGKLGKMAGEKLGKYIGTAAGQQIGGEVSKEISGIGSVLPKWADKIGGQAIKDSLAKAGQTTSDKIISRVAETGATTGAKIGAITGKTVGAASGYMAGSSIADVFTTDESKITDFYVMLIDKSNNTFWLSSGNPELITSNPQNAVLIHKGENGINSKKDLENKLKSDKFDEVFKDYKINVMGIDSSKATNVIEEGIASAAIKTAAKVIGKAVAKASPKAAKVLSKPVVRKAGTVAAKKLIRSKIFRNAIRTISRSKVYSVLKNKKLIQAAVKVGDKAILADTCMDIYEMIKDYKSGKYRDVSWETIAAAGGTLVYTVSPKEITSGDEEFDKEIAKEGLKSFQEDLKKYKEWKSKQPKEEDQNIAAESVIIFEETRTYRTYFNILLESAQTDAEKLKVIEKADPKFAEVLKNSVDKSGKVKISESEASKAKKLISKDQVELNKIKSANHKVTKENVDKILKNESSMKSLADEIFSKETLMSLIPFSTKPTIGDINNFFSALHDWSKGTYKFDELDHGELIGIGVDIGIQTIILLTGGAAAFTTFGISMILAILGCAATIGYIFDSMTRIGRNYSKRKAAVAV